MKIKNQALNDTLYSLFLLNIHFQFHYINFIQEPDI